MLRCWKVHRAKQSLKIWAGIRISLWGESISFGFTVQKGSAEQLPENFLLEELTQTGTDTLLFDTDDNGIGDGEEDTDGDGLSNREELAAGTGVLYPDSDGDGLSDGEEVLMIRY